MGHDEYWSWQMRENVELGRDAGVGGMHNGTSTLTLVTTLGSQLPSSPFQPSPLLGPIAALRLLLAIAGAAFLGAMALDLRRRRCVRVRRFVGLTVLFGLLCAGCTRGPVNGIQDVPLDPPTPDFTLSAAPSSQSVIPGGSTSYTVSTGVLNGFSGSVSLSVSGLPAGATVSFSPSSTVAAGSSSTLAITTTASTPISNSTLTITGTSGSLTHTATVTLSVAAASDFTLSATPTSQSVIPGGSTSYTVSTGVLNGFSGSVSLSASGLPAGATVSFSPSSTVAAGSSSTLTIATTASTPISNSTLTITGTSGSHTHTATVTLSVAAAPDFTLSATPTSQSVIPGGSTSYTVSTGVLNGFSGSVSLSVSGLPAGATVSFSPSSTVAAGSSSTLTLTTTASTPISNSTLTITGTSGSLTHTATVTLSVAAAPDFTLSATPTSQSVIPGGSTSYTVSTGALNGFSGSVSLSVSGLPAGATVSFSPSSPVAAGSSSTLTITTTASTPISNSTLTITGTSGSLTHTATVTLSVAAAPDFTLSATPTSQSVIPGGSTSYTVSTGVLNGFSGSVSLSVSGLPAGATVSFSPSSTVAAGSSSTLTITTTASTPISNSTLTITGTSGSLTHTVTVTLNVTGEWAWMSGSSGVNQSGTYGTLGAPALANVPGGRESAVGWTDTSGNLWLSGGHGLDSTGAPGFLQDLWSYNIGTGEWTWMSGSTVINQQGTYGTQGTPAPANVPGARVLAASWTDTSGNLWLFGGVGFDSAGVATSDLNDLWSYNISSGQWTWMSGSSVGNQTGTYGTLGTSAPANVPGGRAGAVSWTDTSGNLWLFGGVGFDSAGTSGDMNDLWMYNITSGQWTWMSGSSIVLQNGTYGTLGTPAPANVPGARDSAVGWTDASGNLWLFGGVGFDSAGTSGDMNDLWMYSISSGQWTWMSGSNVVNQIGTYGTQGTSAPANVPGARDSDVSWTDMFGNLWLFGGHGFDSAGTTGRMNDLWSYNISSGEWTWISGSNVSGQTGTYGTLGTPAPANVPGARPVPVSWIDTSGNLWLFGGVYLNGTPQFLNDLWMYLP